MRQLIVIKLWSVIRMKVNIDYLRRLRRQNKLNLSDVAHIVGKDRSTIWRYENGKSEISTDVLFALADYYQVSADALRWRDPDGWTMLKCEVEKQ